MGIAEKIANAKETNWLSEGLSESEVKAIVDSAKQQAQKSIKNHAMKQW